MAVSASGTYQQSGPAAPQTARAVLFAPPGQTKGVAALNAYLVASGVRFQARAAGSGGEAITIALTAAGASTPLSVTVSSNAITVHLATDAAANSISTAREVADAVNTTAASSALVAAAVVTGEPNQVVAPLTATALAGDTALANTGQQGNAPLPSQHPPHDTYA